MSPSDHEDDNDPDGPFAFKRRRYCAYYAVSIFTAVILTVYGSQNHICTLFFFHIFLFLVVRHVCIVLSFICPQII